MEQPEKSKATFPYARLKGMNVFMSFLREPGWKPSRIDASILKKLGIATGKEREAIVALKFLEIIDEQGKPTGIFDELKSEYQSTLKRVVLEKYSELFALIPPRMVNQFRLVNFFGTTPETAEYQAKLFVWLCGQAEIELPNVEKHFHRSRFDKNIEN